MTRAAAEAALDAVAARLGDRLGVDGPVLLRERAEILGIAPAGTISAGGTARLLRVHDGRWIALNLARRDDVELLPAWMEREIPPGAGDAPWDAITAFLAEPGRRAWDAVERAQLLGIPAAVALAPDELPVETAAPPVRIERGASRAHTGTPRVLDLSALWAGPLCARLLGARGAHVVKVELAGRPDGARAGDPAFWARLNGAKEEVTLTSDELAARLDAADAVVTSARPRAVEQLGLDLDRRVREDGLVWVAITGYGATGPGRDRVAFGDDAAVAGGLAVLAGGPDAPEFVADAPADPLAGLHAAVAATEALDAGVGAVLDASMRDCVAAVVRGVRAPKPGAGSTPPAGSR